jgi:hypothetical protein
MNLEQLKFPIGKFEKPENITNEILSQWKNDIATFPKKIKNEVEILSDNQLDTPYRPDGWTIRQVVHHCADSHINSFIRFKLALTENNPTIKPYYEERWAELSDSKYFPVEPSLKILEGIHHRWSELLDKLTIEDLEKTFTHPEQNKTFTLLENIGVYAWHCNHHLAHITTLKVRNNW